MDNENTKSGYVALVGKPNVGKSTLLNNILGTKLSIVTAKPQTTRKRILGIHTFENCQIVFLDTPGMLRPKYEMQKAMMSYVTTSLEEADIVAYIVDIADAEETFIPDEIRNIKDKPILLLVNKTDLFKDIKHVLPIISNYSKTGIFKEIIPMSGLKGSNVNELLQIIKKYLPESEFYYDPEMLSTQPERFFVSEIIREFIFNYYKQEIPYSTEVSIIEFKERVQGKWYISAEIIIERQSQKPILIGKGGSKLKQIGELARIEIEEHLGTPVYLELFVKVRDKWRSKPGMLKSFGY